MRYLIRTPLDKVIKDPNTQIIRSFGNSLSGQVVDFTNIWVKGLLIDVSTPYGLMVKSSKQIYKPKMSVQIYKISFR